MGTGRKRVHALTDRYVGAGGIAAGIVVTLLLFAGLSAVSSIVYALIIGEVGAKFSMAFLTAYGKPFREGIHSYLHQFSRPVLPIYFFAALRPPHFSTGRTIQTCNSRHCDDCEPDDSPPGLTKFVRRGERRRCWCLKRDYPGLYNFGIGNNLIKSCSDTTINNQIPLSTV